MYKQYFFIWIVLLGNITIYTRYLKIIGKHV